MENQLKAIPPNSFKCTPLDPADSHNFLAQYLYRVLAQGLAEVKPEKKLSKDAEKRDSRLQKQIRICNEIINSLERNNIEGFDEAKISKEAKKLLSIMVSASDMRFAERPDTPLSIGALLSGTNQDPTLISQLTKEIATADRVDILCSFIKWSGIRILAPALRMFTKRNDTRLRIITTSYMGATDLKAVNFLSDLPSTEIKVSYDTHRTRLHAKSYLIHRETGFSSAYIGSANISQAALTDGLEWNIKISQYEQPYQWDKISATFETYWNDKEFETYDQQGDSKRLEKALIEEASPKTDNEYIIPYFHSHPISP
ncbi:putative HKD family nuclease [Sedimentisphaera cyanobacteriorum]|uniref:Putative HKD family nuclease n=1 Tax=Sedimentisphaera cyanobacteriorum TaxID=1940790 RepID=A0A1Q2HPJ3_9BACT|nr:phospholipase D-like domain-containing protein [Sedimentisphaera cyanobacteriorum]AQQ09251.1 putative HKD family nuclease [Sedimentisphaera cyanobacteriorum]